MNDKTTESASAAAAASVPVCHLADAKFGLPHYKITYKPSTPGEAGRPWSLDALDEDGSYFCGGRFASYDAAQDAMAGAIALDRRFKRPGPWCA